jgi:serine/threonine protein phosphatase PrpC
VNGRIISVNVGDTRAILIKSQNDILSIKPLSNDHKPNIPIEKVRIEQSGGMISRSPDVDDAPYRVWVKDKNYPGLAMSRSIGYEQKILVLLTTLRL